MCISVNRSILVHTHYLMCISKNYSCTKGFESSLTAKDFHKFSRKQVKNKNGSTLIVYDAFLQQCCTAEEKD